MSKMKVASLVLTQVMSYTLREAKSELAGNTYRENRPFSVVESIPALKFSSGKTKTIHTTIYCCHDNIIALNLSINSVLSVHYHERRWLSGTILACHPGGPGSIPGRDTLFNLKILHFYFN